MFDSTVIWVYRANEFNRGARPRVDNEARNSLRVKDAVLSDLMGLLVYRIRVRFAKQVTMASRDRGRRLETRGTED